MRYKLICCEVLYREACAEVAQTPHLVDVEFVPKGLHDMGAPLMLARLQEIVDAVDGAKYDAVLLGYALCNNGVAGLIARDIPLVLPRAHDCISLFMGSRERYLEYFNANPGVYFETTGWMERGAYEGDLSQLSVQSKTGMDKSYEELVEKYGEENAKYLWDTLCDTTHNYSQITYIEMGMQADAAYEAKAREKADERGWRFEKMPGDMRLIRSLIRGEWPAQDFLVIEPGMRVTTSFDETIVKAETVDG